MMRKSCAAAAAHGLPRRVAAVDPYARLRVKEGMRFRREMRRWRGHKRSKPARS